MRPVRPMAWPRDSMIAVAVVTAALLSSCGGNVPSGTAAPSDSGGTGGSTPIVIDTDLGADDMLAIAILLRDPSLRVEAITLSGTGLVHCDPGLDNLRNLLHQFDMADMAIACGSPDAGPDGRAFPDDWRAGTDAAYSLNLPSAASSGSGGEAADVLAEAILGTDEQVTIVELGPWTNLEALFAANSELVDHVAVIHAMGGTLDAPGNVTDDTGASLEPSLEWNLAADPSAVAAVLELGVPTRFVSLDATDRVPVDRALYERLRADHTAAGANLAYELLTRNSYMLGGGTFLWDELAALALLDDDLVGWTRTPVLLDAAGHIERSDAGPEVEITTDVAAASAVDALLVALGAGDARADPFEVAGRFSISWDGTNCTTDGLAAPTAGFWDLTFRNRFDGPAAGVLVSVTAPHTWDDLLALLETIGPTEPPPEWIVLDGYVEAAASAEADGLAQIPTGVAGPVCASQEKLETQGYVAGEPVTVTP